MSEAQTMNHLDLFTGILGFAYAAKAVWGDEYNLVACCEKDKFCQELIRKRAPGVPIFDDIKTLSGSDINEPIDIVTGGFPCQPFSIAGKQQGKEDDRYLWDEMLRIIAEIRPTWVVGENVTGIIKLALDDVLASLEAEGYTTETYIIPAASIGAPHIRERVWIVGHHDGERQHNGQIGKFQGQKQITESIRSHADDPNTKSTECKRGTHTQQGQLSGFANNGFYVTDTDNATTTRQRKHSGKIHTIAESKRPDVSHWEKHWMEVATEFCRVDDGVSNRVDRLRALGNAIVPQVAMAIFEAIKLHELNRAI